MRVEAVAEELRSAVAELPEPGYGRSRGRVARLETLAGSVAAVTSQLEQVESGSTERAREAASRAAELERMLAEVGERLDAVERERDAAATELTARRRPGPRSASGCASGSSELSAAHADASQAQEELAPPARRR